MSRATLPQGNISTPQSFKNVTVTVFNIDREMAFKKDILIS
jgi:hypothetical protein